MFHPHAPGYQEGSNTVRVQVAPQRYIVGEMHQNSAARYTILLSHGNAEDLGDLGPVARFMVENGFSVFAYDYEGYGRSSAGASESAVNDDVLAAFDYLVNERKIPAHRIIAYGRSIGGGPAVELATRRPVAALALESTFRSAFRVATKVKLVPFDAFDNGSKLNRVHCPVLVMHGKRDSVIAFWHGEYLFSAASEPKRFLAVDQADHMDVIWLAGKRWVDSMHELERLADNAAGVPIP